MSTLARARKQAAKYFQLSDPRCETFSDAFERAEGNEDPAHTEWLHHVAGEQVILDAHGVWGLPRILAQRRAVHLYG